MCCFSGPVREVADTKIFARREGNTQFLAYQMRYSADRQVAMILPIPIALPAREDSVRFLDLKGYPTLFTDIAELWPPVALAVAKSIQTASVPSTALPRLAVQDVGEFAASFVPSVSDFERLDPRFRLPRQVWDSLPRYASFGFVVFQLKELGGTPHPMAFSFPTRLESEVFYPTVHIHDGKAHPEEHFDHLLYLQAEGSDWEKAPSRVTDHVTTKLTSGLVLPNRPIFRQRMLGVYSNEDILVKPQGAGFSTVGKLALGAIAVGGVSRWLLKKRG